MREKVKRLERAVGAGTRMLPLPISIQPGSTEFTVQWVNYPNEGRPTKREETGPYPIEPLEEVCADLPPTAWPQVLEIVFTASDGEGRPT